MKPNNVFLFYYSLIATTILLLATFFILPRPQNIANIILLAPVVFFLWTHAFNPDFFSAPKWSPKFGALTIIFCLLGIFSYFLFTKLPPTAPAPNNSLGEIKQAISDSNAANAEFRNRMETEIGTLKTKLDMLGGRDTSVLGDVAPVPTPTPQEVAIGKITVRDANLTGISIYETSSVSSNVKGSAVFGTVYPYYQKLTDWYKIDQGWVEARWFTEVNP